MDFLYLSYILSHVEGYIFQSQGRDGPINVIIGWLSSPSYLNLTGSPIQNFEPGAFSGLVPLVFAPSPLSAKIPSHLRNSPRLVRQAV